MIPVEACCGSMLTAELSLEGKPRSAHSILLMGMECKERGLKFIYYKNLVLGAINFMKRMIGFLLSVVFVISCAGCQQSEQNSAKSASTVQNIKESAVSENEVDYSQEFGELKGCCVFYDSLENSYNFYNKADCKTRYSPNSIFKIISTLEGLECGAVTSETSTMNYNGNTYPIESWNANLNLKEAFQNSCVWYYRQLIDKIGEETMKKGLEEIGYGNCDISEWNGSGLASTKDTNGFWLGSSLKISPLEAVNVTSKIFEGKSKYSKKNISILKNIMESDVKSIYGKTGTGIDNSAWYTGFYEKENNKIYFALHLQSGGGTKITGADARKIVVSIIQKYYI